MHLFHCLINYNRPKKIDYRDISQAFIGVQWIFLYDFHKANEVVKKKLASSEHFAAIM